MNRLKRQGLFTRANVEQIDPGLRRQLDALPGESAYTRGPYPNMYRDKPWTIRQYTGFGSAEDTNRAFRQSLAEGSQGLSVAFDLPTHLGLDSDHPHAIPEVGCTGVAIDSVDDMKRLFEGIDLSTTSVSMTMNGAVLPVLAAFIVAAEESGTPAHQLKGTIQNDILKEFAVRNTWIHAPEPSLRITTDIVEWLSQQAPQFNSMSISGYHYQEGGASSALELALTLANAQEYLQRIQSAGLPMDHFCHRLSFFFGVGMNFYEEIAKLRAARLLWSEEVLKRGGSPKSARMKIHCQTSGWSLTAQEPHNNLIRTTIEAMAAVFGGTQSLHTNGYDEALSLPSEASARLARNTQLILQLETGITDAVDPWAGSYLMESLTADMVAEVRDWLDQIQQQGGLIAAIESGRVQNLLHKAALEVQQDIDAGERAILGINAFKTPSDPHSMVGIESLAVTPPAEKSGVAISQLTPNGARNQQQQLRKLKESRDQNAVDYHLRQLTQAVQNIAQHPEIIRPASNNLLQLTIEAIRARATVGECVTALTDVWPRYQAPLHYHQKTTETADAPDAVKSNPAIQSILAGLRTQLGRKPRILLTKLGLDGHDRGIRIMASTLDEAGFDVRLLPLMTDDKALLKALASHPADAIGLSLLSGAHKALLPPLLAQLPAGFPVFLGGIVPTEDRSLLKKQGITAIFDSGMSLAQIVRNIAETLIQIDQFQQQPERHKDRSRRRA